MIDEKASFGELKHLIDKLEKENSLTLEEFEKLISNQTFEAGEYLSNRSREIRHNNYGRDIYIRGLIEFSNYCKNNCYYCGIRSGNLNADRYRLSKDEILASVDKGYKLGFRTFVLQGGEDNHFSKDFVSEIITTVKKQHADCAITLSMGEQDFDTYKEWFKSGADRYLLRHETADNEHYKKLHPENLSLEHRKQCLFSLKKIGYQVGTGFMVGTPEQTPKTLAKDMIFIHELKPQMVGIGPFIPHKDTPFKDKAPGTVQETVFMLGLLRLMLPKALLPSTTALGTIDPTGREQGILAGANVVMPNLSPTGVRDKYLLYNNKLNTGVESAECGNCLRRKMEAIGYDVVVSRGDAVGFFDN